MIYASLRNYHLSLSVLVCVHLLILCHIPGTHEVQDFTRFACDGRDLLNLHLKYFDR